MLYKEMGKTGKSVSAIGFGGMRFREEEYLKGDYDTPAAVVLRAYELGVNYFDTGPGYCHDHSEKIFGHAFKQLKKKPYVSTKCGLWLATTADQARRLIETSLSRLNVDYIDFYNLWCIRTMDEYSQMMKKGGIYDGIVKAKEEGLISHICCTVHLDGAEVAQVVNDGWAEVITLGYNALNFAYRREGIQACYDKGVGTVVMNPLGGGVIPRHPNMFGFIRERESQSLADAALRFLVGQREVTVALPGMSSLREAEENCAAAENVLPVTKKTLDEMSEKLSHQLNTLCTGCAYCDDCPQGIPIPQLLDAYNEYLLSDGSLEATQERMQVYWGIEDPQIIKKCTECGQCEALCTQKLPIIERLRLFADMK